MEAKQSSESSVAVNEGEGNKTAAREYNDAQRRFVESGQVEKKAREAEQALDGPEGPALRDAEAIGKRHAAEEDPAIGLVAQKQKIRERAYELWEREGRPEGRHDDHWHQAVKDLQDK